MGLGRALPVIWCLLLLIVPAGCGREQEADVPAACRQGEDAVRRALRVAPDPVSLDGARLSACLGTESDAGELQDVGTAYLEAATGLATAAADRPDGPAATQLGYLIGAARRGAPDHHGVNAELMRRLEQELLRVDTRAGAFRRGERAGRRGG